MAGIGFELRKLFKQDNKLSYIKAYLFSSIVTIGPTLLCILLISFFQILMMYKNVKTIEKEFFMASVMYCFIFSIIISGIFNMPLSRYLSDLIFEKNTDKILSSFFGSITLSIGIGGILGIVFLFNLDCTIIDKLLIYLLYTILIIIWIEMIYISAIDDYKSIVRFFSIGVILGVISALILSIFGIFKIYHTLFFSIILTFSIIAISFLTIILKSFKLPNIFDYFEFIISFDKYKNLVLTSLILTLSIYSHNFIFWTSNFNIKTKENFYFTPVYDTATFFAFLSIMPSLVLFVVSMETSFYKSFTKYLSTIKNNGTLNEIKDQKLNVSKTLDNKMSFIMEVQLIISMIILISGNIVLPKIGVSSTAVDIFNLLIPGYYFYICMYIIIIILLYFDDQSGAFLVSALFLTTSILFSIVTILSGVAYYGIGFSLASLFTLIFAYIRIKYYFRTLEQHILSSGELAKFDTLNIFSKFYSIYKSVFFGRR